jgi:tripartite-type tricarboxylate transporter receptor subunit TctC
MRALSFFLARTLAVAIVATGAAGAPRTAQAQAGPYPSRTVTVVVPFSAGGSVDAAARLVVPKLAERLKATVIIENVAGASGTIGTQRVVKSAPDGHTLLFAVASPITVAPLVQPGVVKYDALKDLLPISVVATSPFVLVGRPGLGAADTAALVQMARSQPGKLSYGTDGVGTSMHLTVEMIKQRAGTFIVHVPYRSGPQVLTELAGGQIDLAVMPVALVQPFIKDNKVKAYGVTSRQRWATLPGVPSLAETPALKDIDVESWYGLLAPAGTPEAVVERLSREMASLLADPELGQRLQEAGLKPLSLPPSEFAALLQKERQSLQSVVKSGGIKIE